jgi:hypothetical protein
MTLVPRQIRYRKTCGDADETAFVLIGPLVEKKTTLPLALVGNVARMDTASL